MQRKEDAGGPNPCLKRSHGDPTPPVQPPDQSTRAERGHACGGAALSFLPIPTVRGEPVRGGVAGMFFGGSGGGAAKQSREREQFSCSAFGNAHGFAGKGGSGSVLPRCKAGSSSTSPGMTAGRAGASPQPSLRSFTK